MINAVILASGFSNRMGSNKLLMKLNGKKIIQYIIDTVKSIPFNDIIVVTSYDEIVDLALKSSMKYVMNYNGKKGISESIKLGIMNSQPCEGYMFFTGDQPLISEKTILKLIRNFNENKDKIILPVYDGFRGSPAIFPWKYRDELLSLDGDIGGKVIIKNNLEDVLYVNIENNAESFDIDTIEDYENIGQYL